MPSRSSSFHSTISFHCANRPVRALRIRNEYVVAELVLPRNKVFLNAFAFSDLIMSLGISTENAGRFPGFVEDLRRRDFKIVVENVRLCQIKPFENMHI